MLTPNNRQRKVLSDPKTIGECWITSSDYPNLAALAADPAYSAFVDKFIIQACQGINRLTNRYWNRQEADYIYINERFFYRDYQTYVLPNTPVNSIVDIYLQVNETFLPVDLTYLQLMTDERTMKIIPLLNYSNSVSPVANLVGDDKLNLWIRFNSGYDKADIPEEVKYATALYVSYLVSANENLSGVKSYRSQTYSQENSTPDSNPLFLQIKDMLQDHILITVH